LPRSHVLLLAALVASLWPVWSWIALRAADPGEGWELVSLATAVLFVLLRKPAAPPAAAALALPALLLLAYAASYPFLPPLLRAAIAMAALAAAASALWFGRPLHLPLAGLLLLSLPLIASLNFYLGYPLRLVVGKATALLLQMNGFAVLAEGSLLVWNGESIAIDAPCSGVKMLWAGAYLAFALAAFRRLDAIRTSILAVLAAAAVVAANVLRAAALFYVEAGIIRPPGDWHAAIGVAVFVVAAVAVAAGASALTVRHGA
jgi:exosortase/archaeosortase family protein